MRQKSIIGKLLESTILYFVPLNICCYNNDSIDVSSLGFFGLLTALTIYLPDDAAAFSRCPESGTTDLPTISYYPDGKFCNVYHKCNCSRTGCNVVESHVCPLAQVYSKSKGTCLGK